MDRIFLMFDSVWAIGAMVLGFGFLIFVHELGHFAAAKAVGIKVTQFAIGFGHAVLSWRKGIGFRRGSTEDEYDQRVEGNENTDGLGETEYRLNWMPLGGYVKMLGQEDLNPEAVSEDERSFGRKPFWARAVVISAGVVMNLIFGVVFFVIAFMSGVEFSPAVVGDVMPKSAAAQAYAVGHEKDDAYRGLRSGDRVLRINGEDVLDFADIAISAALARMGDTLEMEVARDGEDAVLVYRLTPKVNEHTEFLAVGVGRPVSLEVDEPGSRALPGAIVEAGVEPGMRVVGVDGAPIERYDQLERAVVAAEGREVTASFARADGGGRVEVPLRADLILDYGQEGQEVPENLMGFVPAVQVMGLETKSPAKKAGVLVGDVLVQVGAVRWPDSQEVIDAVKGSGRDGVEVVVSRGGELVEIGKIKPGRTNRIGIVLGPAVSVPVVRETLSGTVAGALNLNSGSRVVSINGEPVRDYGQMWRRFKAVVDGVEGDAPVEVRVGYELNIADRVAEVGRVELDADAVAALGRTRWVEPLAGSPYRLPAFKMLLEPISATNPVAATRMGLRKTKQFILQTYLTVARLFQGTVKVKHLRGPVGITNEGARIAKQGWAYLMFFLGLISVNLAVINFLPIPIVDGGLMVLLLVEKIKGSPVSPGVQSAINYVGLALIGTVFLMTLYYDVQRLLPS